MPWIDSSRWIAGRPRRRVKHFSPPELSGCDYLKHGTPSARGHVVKGHVARPARNPAGDRTMTSDRAGLPGAGQVAGTNASRSAERLGEVVCCCSPASRAPAAGRAGSNATGDRMALHDVQPHVRTQGEGPASVERRTKPRTGLRLRRSRSFRSCRAGNAETCRSPAICSSGFSQWRSIFHQKVGFMSVLPFREQTK